MSNNGNAWTRTTGGSRKKQTLRSPLRKKESTAHHFSLLFFPSSPANRAPPPATTDAGGLSSGGGARPHGQMRRRPWPPPPVLLYVRWRRPRTELTAARGSRSSLGAEQQGDGLRKRASSHSDEETFMACDRICACCKCVFYVFQMFDKDVASVSCGCCKSRSGCFSVAT
jgi:hypothetical protein